jgi:tetratricopeptide (TPR) repeat protein
MTTKVLAGKFIIKSEPSGALVMVQASQGGAQTKVGVTPLEIDHSQIEAITNGVAFKIELVKQGFEAYKLLVASSAKEDFTWQVVLEPAIEDKANPDIDFLVSELFEAQRLVRAKDLKGAMMRLNALEQKFPNVSSVYEMKGSVNYLNKDFNVALSEYRKAFTLNPQNKIAQQMKAYLESKIQNSDKDKL